MADNITLDGPGDGGSVVATDEDGSSQHHQWIKLKYGPADTFTVVTATDGLPIQGDGTDLPISGSQVEDGASGAGDSGVGVLAVRKATPADTSGTDGDYEFLQMDNGRLWASAVVSDVIPGTGATNLGKAEDAAHTSGDVGVMALGVRQDNPLTGQQAGSDGDYEPLMMDGGRVLVAPNMVQVIDTFADHTSWAALDNNVDTLASDGQNYLVPDSSVTFNKVDGAINTVYGLIDKTQASTINFLNGLTGAAFWQIVIKIPDLSDVANVVLRAGTDDTNYGEWKADVSSATAGIWQTFRIPVASQSSAEGTGWGGVAVDYFAVGLEFNAETDTLSAIQVDALIFNGGNVVEADLSADVTSDISSANVNINKVGNKVVNTQAGAVGTGTMRVVLATDQNFVQQEDEAFVDADYGVGVMSVRLDTAAAKGGTDGDYQPLITDNAGHLHVHDKNSAAILADTANMDTNLGTVAGAIYAEDVAFQDADPGVAVHSVRLDTAAAKGATDGDYQPLITDDAGHLHVHDKNSAAALTALQIIDNPVIAHDAAASGGSTSLVGARATNSVEGLTQVANADASYIASDLNGVLISRPHTTLEEIVTYHNANTAGTELAVTNLGAGGAGVHNYVTSIMVHNAHATTNGFIQLLDGSAGTVLATIPAPALGGSVVTFPVPLKQTTANTALYWDGSAAITTMYVSIIGFQAQG